MANVVVCGAGVNGLTTAMMLAKDGHAVTVLERDPSPPPDPAAAWEDWERRGVGQFRLAHFLLPGFRKVVREELPDLEEALVAGGALALNVLGPFAEALDPEGRNVVLTGRRPVIEAILARAAETSPGVAVRRGVALTGVVTEGADPPRIVGVRTDGGEEIRGDLVVDALGRRSPMARWLTEAGARPPVVEEEDSGFVYYGRHVRTADRRTLGPTLAFFGSVGLLLLPADDGVTGVGIIAWSGDAELRALRHEGPWRAAMALLPEGQAVLDAEPVDEIAVMAGIEDRYRRYVVDGAPVATGFVSVGDAWAATNPTLGRGISLGVRHAQLLRDLLRAVPVDDHDAVTREFDARTEAEQTPWYRSTVWHDRHRVEDFRAAIDGRRRQPDERWDRFRAYMSVSQSDLVILPHFLDTFRLDRLPEAVLEDPAVLAHLDASGIVAPEPSGPTRQQLLEAVASAGAVA
ncbi:MAG TPA: FAD-dependent oxidoreductase [Acidimicrobiales bacterium]|nr:FAD-dependent oxidoreductase [Acidimicrobiales bacterium]